MDNVNYISCFRGKVRWVQRGLYHYSVYRYQGGSTYYRCGTNGCLVRWLMKGGCPGPLKGLHDHDPQHWIPERNEMFCSIKKRCISEPERRLKTIYEEEANRYMKGALHLGYQSILPSMRKWRRSGKKPVVKTT